MCGIITNPPSVTALGISPLSTLSFTAASLSVTVRNLLSTALHDTETDCEFTRGLITS
jgi:hypothetical protein